MLYIITTKTEDGYYHSPQSLPAQGLAEFPEEFLDKFIELNGFVNLTITDGIVTAIRANNAAREAWLANIEEQVEITPSGNTDGNVVTWAELDAAYNEGRDAAYDE